MKFFPDANQVDVTDEGSLANNFKPLCNGDRSGMTRETFTTAAGGSETTGAVYSCHYNSMEDAGCLLTAPCSFYGLTQVDCHYGSTYRYFVGTKEKSKRRIVTQVT